MGATTLYHPISLHVIRGAAEYHGWRFGKVQHTGAVPERGEATYRVEIIKRPEDLASANVKKLHKALQDCYTDDVRVSDLTQTFGGKLTATLQVWVARQAVLPQNT